MNPPPSVTWPLVLDCTVTPTAPETALAGTWAEIVVLFVTTMPVASADPTVTLMVGSKPVPTINTVVRPSIGPLFGMTCVMVGGPLYRKRPGNTSVPWVDEMIVIGTIAYAGVLFVNFILSLFGVNTGIISVTGQVSVIALLASAVGVGLAVFNLILDFDYIEQGIAVRAPASESWRAAFGLTVTMVWLYTEILRILAYFQRN